MNDGPWYLKLNSYKNALENELCVLRWIFARCEMSKIVRKPEFINNVNIKCRITYV